MGQQWNATLYDEAHQFVSAYGQGIAQLLAPQQGEHILDVGCGTGDLMATFAEAGADVVGIDQSAQMIAAAQQKYPALSFEVANICTWEKQSTYDAVFSNAVLHWVKDAKTAAEAIYDTLKPGGRFVAEFGGNGNVATITNAIRDVYQAHGLSYDEQRFPWYFPTIGEYTTLLESVGFDVAFAYHYDRPTMLQGEQGLRNWLAMFGDELLQATTEQQQQQFTAEVEALVKPALYVDGTWYADYKRLQIIAYKRG